MAATYNVKKVAPNRIELIVVGELTLQIVSQLANDLKAIAPEQRRKVLIDFRSLQSCPLQARTALIEIHRGLKSSYARIAYVADSSLMRGLALWLCHLSEDENSKPFSNEQQAEEWLAGTGQRVSDNHKSFVQAVDTLAKKGR